MIIEGRKSLELRFRRPPSSKFGRRVYLLSSGEALGIIKIVSCSGPFSKAELLERSDEHLVGNPISDQYGWNVEVVKRFRKRKKYSHPRGARIWLKNVQFGKPSMSRSKETLFNR